MSFGKKEQAGWTDAKLASPAPLCDDPCLTFAILQIGAKRNSNLYYSSQILLFEAQLIATTSESASQSSL